MAPKLVSEGNEFVTFHADCSLWELVAIHQSGILTLIKHDIEYSHSIVCLYFFTFTQPRQEPTGRKCNPQLGMIPDSWVLFVTIH